MIDEGVCRTAPATPGLLKNLLIKGEMNSSMTILVLLLLHICNKANN